MNTENEPPNLPPAAKTLTEAATAALAELRNLHADQGPCHDLEHCPTAVAIRDLDLALVHGAGVSYTGEAIAIGEAFIPSHTVIDVPVRKSVTVIGKREHLGEFPRP